MKLAQMHLIIHVLTPLRSELKIQLSSSPLAFEVPSDAILDFTFDVTVNLSFNVTFEVTCDFVFAVQCQV